MTPALLVSFLAFMATGVPVAIAMAGSVLIYILLTGDSPPFVVIHRMVSGIDSFPLLAVPFFILAGNLMNNAGITNRIYNFALALVGWMKGGLGHVNIIGSVICIARSPPLRQCARIPPAESRYSYRWHPDEGVPARSAHPGGTADDRPQ